MASLREYVHEVIWSSWIKDGDGVVWCGGFLPFLTLLLSLSFLTVVLNTCPGGVLCYYMLVSNSISHVVLCLLYSLNSHRVALYCTILYYTVPYCAVLCCALSHIPQYNHWAYTLVFL